MLIVAFSDARSCLTDVVNEVAYAGKRVILTRQGKRLAAIVSMKDLEALEAMRAERDKLLTAKKVSIRRKRNETVQGELGKA